jgi:hypothetical protein
MGRDIVQRADGRRDVSSGAGFEPAIDFGSGRWRGGTGSNAASAAVFLAAAERPHLVRVAVAQGAWRERTITRRM